MNMMINFDEGTGENTQKHNSCWLEIGDHPYRILIVGNSRSRKRNALLNLLSHEPDIDKIF